jgi:redox-sensitive bicupin YhaK (pirin superfamily)
MRAGIRPPRERLTTLASREVELLVEGRQTQDGAGVKLTRVLTRGMQHRLDPFLLLDEFKSDNPNDYIGGFPDHPHRGFETITYLRQGRLRHRDNHGGAGVIENGDVQWMTAGRGVVHSEMPEQKDGLLHGFQLWLNLAARDKMIEPAYRDLRAAEIPAIRTHEVAITIIAGAIGETHGAMEREKTQPLILDVHVCEGGHFDIGLPTSHNAFVYVYAGSAQIGNQRKQVAAGTLAVLDNVEGAEGVRIASMEGAELLVIAGQPLNEPIVQHGPFVMNTPEQIAEAMNDYRLGRF